MSSVRLLLRRHRFGLTMMVLVAGITLVGATLTTRRVEILPAAGSGAAPNPGPVDGTAWLEVGDSGAPVRVWAVLENRSDRVLRDVSFTTFRVPGFVRVGPCWSGTADSWPTCVGGAGAPAAGPWTVAARSALVVHADLAASAEGRGRFVLGGLLDWSDDAGTRGQTFVRTGAVDVAWRLEPFGISEQWWDFLRDLALPLTLLVMGVGLQRVLQRRTEKQAVWDSLLPKSHENAERHYIPIATAINTFLDKMRELAPNPQQPSGRAGGAGDFDEPTYWLLLVLKRVKRLQKRIGGFYFKTRAGEDLAASCWFVITKRRKMIGRELLDRVLDQIGAFESLAEFKTRRRGHGHFDADFCRVRKALMDWAGFDPDSGQWTWADSDLRFVIRFLRLLGIVLEVESNRPHALWYGDEGVPEEDLSKLQAEIRQAIAARKAANKDPDETAEAIEALLGKYKRLRIAG